MPHISAAPYRDRGGFIISISLTVTCPGSLLSCISFCRSLFDLVGFINSLQPLVVLHFYCNEMSYWINTRRPCFDCLKWHHTAISVTVKKKNVGEKSKLDKYSRCLDIQMRRSRLFLVFLFCLYILLSWTAALRNLFFLSLSPQEAFCMQHTLDS